MGLKKITGGDVFNRTDRHDDENCTTPSEPDMPLNVAEEIVAALPTAYTWIFERLGFGDVV